MQRVLMILEVSQKQNYIFASKILKENMQRSENISHVTSRSYFSQVCPGDFDPDVNLVYSGGGHTVLKFFSEEEAERFARAVTRQVMIDYPGMELFVKQLNYMESRSPGENLNELSRQLESKKSYREHAFRTHALGIEESAGDSGSSSIRNNFKIPRGWKTSKHVDLNEWDDNFLAVVHIDGNAMGARVQEIYKACKDSWQECERLLKQFSSELQQHFDMAFDDMAQELAVNLEPQYRNPAKRILPLRKIIGAGDDVCFITTGKHGMECAASFLRHLSKRCNGADGKRYTACAGVVLVHKKYPFRHAYDLSEELCRNAKSFCTAYGGEISALDFHIEFGQMKDSLAEIRSDYITDDGARLELRPLAVTGTDKVPLRRTYDFHTGQLRRLLDILRQQEKQNENGLARSKVKSLRPYLHQGEIETMYAIRKNQAGALLDLNRGEPPFFTDDKGIRRCLYFDTIELLDSTVLWQEMKK